MAKDIYLVVKENRQEAKELISKLDSKKLEWAGTNENEEFDGVFILVQDRYDNISNLEVTKVELEKNRFCFYVPEWDEWVSEEDALSCTENNVFEHIIDLLGGSRLNKKVIKTLVFQDDNDYIPLCSFPDSERTDDKMHEDIIYNHILYDNILSEYGVPCDGVDLHELAHNIAYGNLQACQNYGYDVFFVETTLYSWD